MKMHVYKAVVFLMMLYFHSPIIAQEKKYKTATSPEKDKLRLENNKRVADFNREVDRRKDKRTDSTRNERTDADRSHKYNELRKRHLDDVRSKKVTITIACNADATVILQNIMHKVNILTTDDNKVMLVATVHYIGKPLLTDTQWLSKLKLGLVSKDNKVEVRSGTNTEENAQEDLEFDSISNGILIFDSLGNAIAKRSHADRDLVLYVPKKASVEIESKYADITFENNMRSIKANIVNGRLSMMDSELLLTNAMYGRIYAQNIGKAEVDITNGRLRAKKIETLKLISKNSLVMLNKVNALRISESQADQYVIEEAGDVSGRKNFGELQLSKLTGSIDLSGENANVKIKTIDTSTRTVKINTQYADLNLPVTNLKSYTVNFQGTGGKLSLPFGEKYTTKDSFTTSVGQNKERLTVIRLACQKCSVDLN